MRSRSLLTIFIASAQELTGSDSPAVVLRERLYAGAQGRCQLLAVSGGEPGQHLLLDGVGGLIAGAEHRAAVVGQAGLEDAAVARMRSAGHPVPVLELAQDLVHGLRGDERVPGQVGV